MATGDMVQGKHQMDMNKIDEAPMKFVAIIAVSKTMQSRIADTVDPSYVIPVEKRVINPNSAPLHRKLATKKVPQVKQVVFPAPQKSNILTFAI